jgi:hypothetical protein
MNAPVAIPTWFNNRVVSGLQFMWSIGLPGTPAAELATLTATSWVEALWNAPFAWDEQADAYRIYAGFTTAAARADRWPTPRAVLDAMPSRTPRPALPLAPPKPMPQHVRERMRTLGSRRTDPPSSEDHP